jgi:hypothetical protein
VMSNLTHPLFKRADSQNRAAQGLLCGGLARRRLTRELPLLVIADLAFADFRYALMSGSLVDLPSMSEECHKRTSHRKLICGEPEDQKSARAWKERWTHGVNLKELIRLPVLQKTCRYHLGGGPHVAYERCASS